MHVIFTLFQSIASHFSFIISLFKEHFLVAYFFTYVFSMKFNCFKLVYDYSQVSINIFIILLKPIKSSFFKRVHFPIFVFTRLVWVFCCDLTKPLESFVWLSNTSNFNYLISCFYICFFFFCPVVIQQFLLSLVVLIFKNLSQFTYILFERLKGRLFLF